jgi:hypothetical protein
MATQVHPDIGRAVDRAQRAEDIRQACIQEAGAARHTSAGVTPTIRGTEVAASPAAAGARQITPATQAARIQEAIASQVAIMAAEEIRIWEIATAVVVNARLTNPCIPKPSPIWAEE